MAAIAVAAQQAQKALKLLDPTYRLRVAVDPLTSVPECFLIEDGHEKTLWTGPRPPTIEEIGALK